MGAKLKSKTHLQNTFFYFWAVFCAIGLKFLKSANMTQQILGRKNQKIYTKMQNLTLILIPILNFLMKFFFVALISTFCKLWFQMSTKRLKKIENLYYYGVLEFNKPTIKGVLLHNVAAHNVIIQNVKESKREHYLTYSVTKRTASKNLMWTLTKQYKTFSNGIRFVTPYIMWRLCFENFTFWNSYIVCRYVL